MAMVVPHGLHRGDILLIGLDPTVGHEIQKTRPCVVVSPDELNQYLQTLIVAPMTSGGFPYPFRIPCRFKRKTGHIVLDQISTIDMDRIIRPLGRLQPGTLEMVVASLQEMFAQ
jgi:mRNA interferase MazF